MLPLMNKVLAMPLHLSNAASSFKCEDDFQFRVFPRENYGRIQKMGWNNLIKRSSTNQDLGDTERPTRNNQPGSSFFYGTIWQDHVSEQNA